MSGAGREPPGSPWASTRAGTARGQGPGRKGHSSGSAALAVLPETICNFLLTIANKSKPKQNIKIETKSKTIWISHYNDDLDTNVDKT